MSRTTRRPFTGPGAISPSCRKGTCPWCAGGRRHVALRRSPADLDAQIREAAESRLRRSHAATV